LGNGQNNVTKAKQTNKNNLWLDAVSPPKQGRVVYHFKTRICVWCGEIQTTSPTLNQHHPWDSI